MKRMLSRLDKWHGGLIETLTPLDEREYAARPSEGEWSVAEIMQHLCMVEAGALKMLRSQIGQAPPDGRGPGLRQRLLPFSLLVGRRPIRVKAPKFVEPLDAPPQDEALAKFKDLREQLKAFAAEQGAARLRRLRMKHPFFGDLDGVRAVWFVGYHEMRHHRQIREVIKKVRR